LVAKSDEEVSRLNSDFLALDSENNGLDRQLQEGDSKKNLTKKKLKQLHTEIRKIEKENRDMADKLETGKSGMADEEMDTKIDTA
jgi:predicted  nucleic acid-binding Zn-ribbon protein